MRLRLLAVALMLVRIRLAAQAPPAAPVALLVPASTRAMALGNAWVAGRDEYAFFYNPAQITATSGFNATVGAYGGYTRLGALAAASTVGRVTLGWGVQVVDFSTTPGAEWPFTAGTLTDFGASDALSLVTTVAGQMIVKGFRIGVAGKYAEDLAETFVVPGGASTTMRGSAVLADLGVAHALWTGVAGLAVQNIGEEGFDLGPAHGSVPLRVALGWSMARQVGPLDVGVTTEVGARQRWLSGGGGVEVGWSWIEGFSVAGRAGVRRPEEPAEKPVALGAAFTADRLAVEYALQFFERNRVGQRLTVRWR
jgi:hypothetical protein